MANELFDADGLAREINRQLSLYANHTEKTINDAAKKAAIEGSRKLKVAGNFKDVTGDYRRGWSAKKHKGNWVIYNETDYRLTHLLEKGHALKRGGRKIGDAGAFVHIKPVEQEVINEFEENIRIGLRQ